MEPKKIEGNSAPAAFVAALPRSASEGADFHTARSGSFGTFLAMPARVVDAIASDFKQGNRALALLIATALGLAIIPETINFLLVKRPLDASPLESMGSETAFASLARWALSAVMLALSSLVVLMRGHPNRDITRVLLLLLALNLPYIVGPKSPGMADLIKIVLAGVVIVAIWNTGASIAELKWVPIIVSMVGAYSILGGLIMPGNFMYNSISRKAIVAGWELAGPFGHSNVLGIYCALSFTLVPLITDARWRLVCGSILFATIVGSASRTSLIVACLVVLWWAACRLRPAISVRLVGTLLSGIFAAGMFVVPFLNWDPEAFTERATVWAESLRVWQQSPVVGLGFNWFLTDAQSATEITKWAYVGTGHNAVVDTLVKSGLAGFVVLATVWVGAVFATRGLRLTNQQIACFGYLTAFFLAATTEAVWDLWPNIQLFPISGLIFSVILLARDGDRTVEGTP